MRTEDTPDGMLGGELQTVRDWLGVTVDRLAAMLEVNPRTVRAWEAGKYPVPEGVREAVECLEADTAVAVGEIVSALHDMRDPAVAVYRTDEDLAGARPDAAHLGARWWRHVVARAATEVPGVIIGTVSELDDQRVQHAART
ncbi:MAG: Aca2/YdiL-like domain-containing protein [Georgenia sp.]